jgi:hypothetical protein
LRDTAVLRLVGAIVAAPWFLYTFRDFSREAAWAARYTLAHLTTAVEGHGTDAFSYVREMPRYFGELVFIPLIGAAVFALRRGHNRVLECLGWVIIP